MANYYDIDDILMEEELLSAVFKVAANGVGFLDPGSETNTIEQGSKVDLPFWLAQELCLRQVASVSVPACFSQKTWKEVQADAACVDLKGRCLHFYELGSKIAPVVGDRSIGTFLLYTFTSRYKEALSKAHSASCSSSPKFLPLLTKEEYQCKFCVKIRMCTFYFGFVKCITFQLNYFVGIVFETARSSMASYKKWRVGGSRLEKASVLGRKRKPIGLLDEPAS